MRYMRNKAGLLNLGVSMVLALLAGCASLGVQRPDNFGEKIEGAYTTVGLVRDTGLRLLQAGKIADQEAQVVQDRADALRAGIEAARDIRKVSEAGAESRLQAVLLTAQYITNCLDEREQPRPEGAEPLPTLAVCIQKQDPPL
jgi:hypothetical protein